MQEYPLHSYFHSRWFFNWIYAPLSSYNPELDKLFQNKKKCTLIHKVDLVSKEDQEAIKTAFKQQEQPFILTSHVNRSNINNIVHSLVQLNPPKFQISGSYFMICGIPNVGKSTIIHDILKSYADTRESMDMNNE